MKLPATFGEVIMTPVGFATAVLGMRLYPWQAKALTWFENAAGRRVKGSLCTPNGAGKDSMVIAALALWWVSMHRRGRVVITSKDSRQIDEQTYPAIERHRHKFEGCGVGRRGGRRELRGPGRTGGKCREPSKESDTERESGSAPGSWNLALGTGVSGAGHTEGGVGGGNIQHPTSNIQYPIARPQTGPIGCGARVAGRIGDLGRMSGWRFLDRYVETSTGGKIILFTTDEPGRAEGFHRETLENGAANREGPLLLIANEAKSVPEGIFSAFDRCTFDGLLYASSPGPMSGRFYESQVRPELGFRRLQIGLKDCPHIPPERIADIVATYGEDAPFTRSTLHGEFMEADGEARFDFAGLEALREMAEVHHASAERGYLAEQEGMGGGNVRRETLNTQHPTSNIQRSGSKALDWGGADDPGRTVGATTFVGEAKGWVWMIERPIPGCAYLGFCDPMTGEQSEGSKHRDTHAAGIMRAPYIDTAGVEHDAELVAAIYVESGPGGLGQMGGSGGTGGENSGAACRWDNDVLAARLAMLLRFYGNCLCICEANNSGTEVIRLLLLEGCRLWRREKPNHRVPGRKMVDVVGFLTTSATKNYWIGTLGTAIRERTLVCRFLPAVKQCGTFILNEKGTGEAQPGCHDDWCTGLGLGLYQMHAATQLPPRGATVPPWGNTGPHLSTWPGSYGAGGQGRAGACA